MTFLYALPITSFDLFLIDGERKVEQHYNVQHQ